MLRSKRAEFARNQITKQRTEFLQFSYDEMISKLILVAVERCVFAADRVERERMLAERVLDAN